MLKSTLTGFTLPLLLLFGSSLDNSAAGVKQNSTDLQTETVQKLIVTGGSATMDVDLARLNDAVSATEESKPATLHFALAPDSFFTIVVTNDLLRGPLPGSMGLIPQNAANLPALLNASLHQLVLEKKQPDEAYDLVIRDSKSGFVFFNVAGHQYDYDTGTHTLSINDGPLLISEEFARQLGRPREAGAVAGKISVAASMSSIEIQTVVNGEVRAAVLPPVRSLASTGAPNQADAVTSVPGPDVIVGDLPSMEQDGSSGSFVGLGVGTTSCNNGNVELDWFALSNTDHPVIPQNLYRMSGGGTNNERFEQVGQSWLKHAFTALQGDACGFGCTPAANGTHLGVGCSDPYGANLNASQGGLGSRAWVNPFTGAFPSTANNHTGHTHTGTSHRVTVATSDLSTTLNPGATYFAEAQYVTPHEYAWCQAHPGQCNQYNNVSYRQFTVTGTTSFTFGTVGATVRMLPAIKAWTGATINQIEPAPGVDGIGFVGYKVTNPSAGVWHYEYAVYNENLDRALQAFTVPVGPGTGVSNIGFHAPPQEPGFANDGTTGNTGYASTPWPSTQTSSSLSWVSQTLDKNINANAIRWGTLYNFRFDSDRPPQATNATIGFFKTGAPITVAIQGPMPPTATPTPSPTPTLTPTPTPTPPTTPTPTPTPSPVLVAMISLPTATINTSVTNFTQPVATSAINGADNLVGFQGDFTFDETVATFQSPPVSGAGLTGGNWNVSGNVLPGAGPIRTLRVSAFSNDFVPLSGSGTLYNLNMTRVSNTSGASTALTWQTPPNDFYFIDVDLNSQTPGSTPPGSITIQAATTLSISGTISYCSNPVPGPVPGVTLTLTGSGSGSTLSDGSGNYTLSSLVSGGSYTVTPTKAALSPGATGINTVDVIAVQRHFLSLGTPLSGCRLTAADVNGSTVIDTVDVIAIQRFFLGLSTGIANTGKYQFSPVNRGYPGIVSNQTGQNYDTLIFGDVASGFVY
jgi:hypothetical protein